MKIKKYEELNFIAYIYYDLIRKTTLKRVVNQIKQSNPYLPEEMIKTYLVKVIGNCLEEILVAEDLK